MEDIEFLLLILTCITEFPDNCLIKSHQLYLIQRQTQTPPFFLSENQNLNTIPMVIILQKALIKGTAVSKILINTTNHFNK